MCGWNIYMHRKTISCRLFLLMLGYFPSRPHAVTLACPNIFNLSFALITSPITYRQAELSSLTLHQYEPKATAYSVVTCTFVCAFPVVNIQKENKQIQKSKMIRRLWIFAINLLCWGRRTSRVMMAENSNEKTNLILKCDPSPTLIYLGQTAFEAKVYSAFACLMFGRDILFQKDYKLIVLMLKKPMSDLSVTVLKVKHIILEKAPSSVQLWVIFYVPYLKLLVKKNKRSPSCQSLSM